MGLGHAALHPVKNPHAAPDGQIGKTVLDGLGGGPPVAQTRHGQQRADEVNAQQDERCPQHHDPYALRHKAVQRQQQRVAPFEHDNAERTPGQRCAEADIAVQIERHGAVIPPAGVGGVFKDVTADPLNNGGVDGAEYQQEEPAVPDVAQRKGDDQRADAVQNAERAAQHAAVLILAADGRRKDDLPHPAEERVGEKEKSNLIKCHNNLLRKSVGGCRASPRQPCGG